MSAVLDRLSRFYDERAGEIQTDIGILAAREYKSDYELALRVYRDFFEKLEQVQREQLVRFGISYANSGLGESPSLVPRGVARDLRARLRRIGERKQRVAMRLWDIVSLIGRHPGA